MQVFGSDVDVLNCTVLVLCRSVETVVRETATANEAGKVLRRYLDDVRAAADASVNPDGEPLVYGSNNGR